VQHVFSEFTQSLAKYAAYVPRQLSAILAFVYLFTLFVCLCVVSALTEPADYKTDAWIIIFASLVTILVGLAAHEYPHKVLSVTAVVLALFTMPMGASLIHIIYGEHKTCAKLYNNVAAMSSLSQRLDELGGVSGSVVSADLLNADATQQVSTYSMLCMGLKYGMAWRNAHLAILYAISSISIIGSLSVIAITLLNYPGARQWVEHMSYATMHLLHNAEGHLQSAFAAGVHALRHHQSHIKKL